MIVLHVIQVLRTPLSLLKITLLVLFPNPTTSSCECGFLLNNTSSNSTSLGATTIFTNILETDFLHLSSLEDTQDWIPQNYTVSPALARGPYGKNASLSNVLTNPLQSAYDFAGTGTNNSGAGGLQLYVRSGSTATPGRLVGASELVTNRSDILYGSFRAGMKVTPVNGTCSAFFFYRNDTQEIDVELLSAQQQQTSHIANLVLQSTQSLQAGFNAAGTPGFLPYDLSFDPTTGFHEYRYDWTPTAVSFYADGILLGHNDHSRRHPTQSRIDSTSLTGPMVIRHGLAVHQRVTPCSLSATSRHTSTPLRTLRRRATCGQGGPNAMCSVPDVDGAPDGNTSARGAWFADGGDGKIWNGTGKAIR